MKKHYRSWRAYWWVANVLCCIGVLLLIWAVYKTFADFSEELSIKKIVPGLALIFLSLPIFFISQSVYFFERKQEPKPDVMGVFLDRAEKTVEDATSTEKKQ